MAGTDHFYAALPTNEGPVSQLVAMEQLFSAVPADWNIVITDIKGSTKAVGNGWHEAVNLVAAGSVIAALNLAIKANTRIPFFFGGDGATLLVPPSLLPSVMAALHNHRDNSLRNFGLELRVGHVNVAEAYRAGEQLHIAKARFGALHEVPLVLGNALKYAERLIKSESFLSFIPKGESGVPDMEGMECRWDTVKPPGGLDEVVCLLVEARAEAWQGGVYQSVLAAIDEAYGPQPARNPISTSMLQLQATLSKINTEMRVKLGRFDLWYLLRNYLITLFGYFYFRFYESGKRYLQNLVEFSDTFVLDGRINTVISGTAEQRQRLTAELERMEAEGLIFFGLHVSKESIMSCYVRDRENQHVHFVDGAEGGYTMAAGMLKKKWRSTS